MLSERTIVVLPEHVGTGLFALGEKPEVQQARTLRDAMQWMALSNPGSYLRALTGNQGDDRRTGAVLRLKARQMAEDYQAIFGGLAREFGITLVAGSIVLPEPYLENDRLRIGDGPLRQVSLTFDGRGKPWERCSTNMHSVATNAATASPRYLNPGARSPRQQVRWR